MISSSDRTRTGRIEKRKRKVETSGNRKTRTGRIEKERKKEKSENEREQGNEKRKTPHNGGNDDGNDFF